MDVQVVALAQGLSGNDERKLAALMESVKLAGKSLVKSPSDNAVSEASKGEYGHILTHCSIVMPGYYEAMFASCEYSSTDYVFCRAMRLLEPGKDPEVIGIPTPDNFILGQILVKSWVLRELGNGDPRRILSRVLTQYRGTEVPHTMCIEVGS